jgi:hypothetical protein
MSIEGNERLNSTRRKKRKLLLVRVTIGREDAIVCNAALRANDRVEKKNKQQHVKIGTDPCLPLRLDELRAVRKDRDRVDHPRMYFERHLSMVYRVFRPCIGALGL